ncbi:MAG: hypothetical protein DME54_13460 [Verrucomicrobia bacterium]|nr:MAG: hypothetical protein DME62_00595 [Verrucomicrobiota bacterium]PYK33189.1 MAG: hypothetical protein DME54_13460 [Verrucomicrobiota bacterium]PYL21849.1 MAG: hypothetical protein DMF41_00905 [Verrucomicrobiota bacterium]
MSGNRNDGKTLILKSNCYVANRSLLILKVGVCISKFHNRRCRVGNQLSASPDLNGLLSSLFRLTDERGK